MKLLKSSIIEENIEIMPLEKLGFDRNNLFIED